MISVGPPFFVLSLVISISDAVSDNLHQVSIHTSSGMHICSGAIITASHVLTSATCVADIERKIRPIIRYVVTGSVNFSEANEANIFEILQIKIPDANSHLYFYENDIAILKVHRNITFGENRMPILLPLNDTTEGSLGKASGWAIPEKLESDEVLSLHLQTTQEEVLNQQECQTLMACECIQPEHVCTQVKDKRERCQLDLAAPLVDDKHLIGILSFSNLSDQGDICVYTHVYKFVSWILEVINSLS